MKNNIAFKGGSYSLAITAIVIAILLVVNVLASILPRAWTQLDISSAKLYSVGSNTKVILNNLQEDVTIYWIVQSGAEDAVIENLLSKYESLSDRITVVKKNPDVYPTFTEQYTTEDVPNNSLIVESADRSRYVSNEDIYEYTVDYYSYETYADAFDGEGAVTSAIDFVISDDFPQLYLLEGHGETDLPATFAEQVRKDNIQTTTFSLLTTDQVPKEADCVMIYGPTSDISTTEKEKLASYVAGGGKLMVMSGPQEEGALDNLNSLLESYGITVNDGIVVEGDENYYVYGYPYILLPELNSHSITDPLIESNYYALMSISSGLTVSENSGDATVTQLLTTTDSAFSKKDGFSLDTYEKEDGDIEGPFALAVSIEESSGGQLVWFASSDYLVDDINSYASGANSDITMNALASLMGETEAMAIQSKSLNYSYLTISESESATIKSIMIGAVPLAYLGIGLLIIWRKRRLQNG